MSSVHSHWINGNLVFYQSNYMQRWLDVMGPAVVKVVDEFQFGNYAIAAGDGSPQTRQGWLNTYVEAGAGGDHTEALTDGADGGVLLITTDDGEDDGVNKQAIGEAFNFSLTNKWPAYFGIRFKVSDATQSDWVAGFCLTDTTLTAGMDDGMYFRSADGSAVVSAVLEKNTTETTGTVHTAANNTYYIYEIVFDGTSVDFYLNGTAITRLATTNIPDDEWLTPSFEYLTGAAGVDTVSIDWIRAFQLQE